jgi:hypothetical protein
MAIVFGLGLLAAVLFVAHLGVLYRIGSQPRLQRPPLQPLAVWLGGLSFLGLVLFIIWLALLVLGDGLWGMVVAYAGFVLSILLIRSLDRLGTAVTEGSRQLHGR